MNLKMQVEGLKPIEVPPDLGVTRRSFQEDRYIVCLSLVITTSLRAGPPDTQFCLGTPFPVGVARKILGFPQATALPMTDHIKETDTIRC